MPSSRRGSNPRYHQEYFADYAPLLPSLFSLNYTPSASTPLYGTSPSTWDPKALDRHVQGLVAVMLSLKKKPVIRYEKMSSMARKLAVELQVRVFCVPHSYVALKLTLESHPSRVATVRFPADPGSAAPPHP